MRIALVLVALRAIQQHLAPEFDPRWIEEAQQ